MQPIISNNIIQNCNKSAEKLCWYAVYTRPSHEKKVYELLKQEKIEVFLPLHTTIRQWSDRKKKVSKPLFRCYLFVNISLREYYTVLNTPGVVRFITFGKKAVIIPEKQIQLIKYMLAQEFPATEVLDFIPIGTKVEITVGSFTGVIGELVEYAGKKRVVIHVDEICKSLLINVSLHFLKLAG